MFLNAPSTDEPAVQDACRAIAECLQATGALVVRDPRVSYADNSAFLDMMERYFGQPHEAKLKDVRAELAYQARAARRRGQLRVCRARLTRSTGRCNA